MKRNISRIIAMMKLYNYDINNGLFEYDIERMIDDESLEYDVIFCDKLYQGVLDNQNEIDGIISSNLTNYAIDRLNYVDRALIRLAVYELKYLKTPKNIVINEIIEISKEYSQTKDFSSSKFNNSILDKIASEVVDAD